MHFATRAIHAAQPSDPATVVRAAWRPGGRDHVCFTRRFFALGESLGGLKSLICHPARMTHASIPAERRAEPGLSDALIRLSPGIEHADDLIADVIDGLDAVAHTRDEKFVIGV